MQGVKNKEKLIGHKLHSSGNSEHVIDQLILYCKPQDVIFMGDPNYADVCQECYLHKSF